MRNMVNEYRVRAMPKGGYTLYDSSGNGITSFTTIDEALNYIKQNISPGC